MYVKALINFNMILYCTNTRAAGTIETSSLVLLYLFAFLVVLSHFKHVLNFKFVCFGKDHSSLWHIIQFKIQELYIFHIPETFNSSTSTFYLQNLNMYTRT